MSEKIAVHCETEEEWGKVLIKIDKVNATWKRAFHDYDDSCINPDDPATCEKTYYIREGYTIISAADYLKDEVTEFQVGDRVECIDNGMSVVLQEGSIYTVHEVDGEYCKIKEALERKPRHSYRTSQFKLIATKQTKEGKVGDSCTNTCREEYNEHEENNCMTEVDIKKCMFLSKTKPKKENDMKDNNTNPDVLAVFGSKVKGDELVVIDRHFDSAMLNRILMEKFSKEIQAECKDAEEKRLAAEAK